MAHSGDFTGITTYGHFLNFAHTRNHYRHIIFIRAYDFLSDLDRLTLHFSRCFRVQRSQFFHYSFTTDGIYIFSYNCFRSNVRSYGFGYRCFDAVTIVVIIVDNAIRSKTFQFFSLSFITYNGNVRRTWLYIFFSGILDIIYRNCCYVFQVVFVVILRHVITLDIDRVLRNSLRAFQADSECTGNIVFHFL
ncbi:hypothetical protein D3C87_1453160 [compost metagenome]